MTVRVLSIQLKVPQWISELFIDLQLRLKSG